MYIWYDDRFTQMKRSNAHQVTLRAVLGMLFVYLCPEWIMSWIYAENTASFTRSSCMCAVNETARLCHSLTEMQNMQDSYLNSVFAA